MKIKNFTLLLLGVCATTITYAQEAEKVDTLDQLRQRVTILEDAVSTGSKLKVGGYVQAQWQTTGPDGTLRVGEPRSTATGLETAKDINRFGIRRGRLKTTYTDFGCSAVVELDMTEKGNFSIRDMYVKLLDPWTNIFSLTGGSMDTPFGYEAPSSSSNLESLERSTITGVLFPDEKNVGAMLTIQAPKTSPWNVIRLNAGLFTGNSTRSDNRSKKDFVGQLIFEKATSNLKYRLGTSMYYGYIPQLTSKVFTLENGAFAKDSSSANINTYAGRIYTGFDGSIAFSSFLGTTILRGEYIFGQQPGSSTNYYSPKPTPGAANPVPSQDTYIRKISGGYVHLVQNIGTTKHTVSVKYDFFDPNTKISGDKIGLAGASGSVKTTFTELASSDFDFTYIYRMNNNVRFMVDYSYMMNEKSANIAGYTGNRNDNVFTIRTQYKF